MKKTTLFIIPVVSLLAGAAFAKDGSDTFDIAAYKASNMNLAQAISLAEQKTGGHAVSADFSGPEQNTAAEFEVSIAAADGTIMDYIVNIADQSVVADPHTQDDSDEEGDHEQNDDN